MKRIVDISDDTFNILKNMVEDNCVDPYSLADIIVNKSIPLQECEFLSTLMQSVMTTEQLKEVFQKMVEEKNRWIPVSERLPDKEEYIQCNGLFIVSDGNRVYAEHFDIYDKKCFGEPTIYGFKADRLVIAWQPLPEPYMEGEEE